MTDRERQIAEMAKEVLSIKVQCKGQECNKHIPCTTCYAEHLYNAGYRKMDEVTLKLDLGDRSAEEIQQIVEAFANEPTTAILAPSNESEIRKQVAKDILQTLHYEIDREKGAGTIYGDFNYGLDAALNKVENIANEYGVEIDE